MNVTFIHTEATADAPAQMAELGIPYGCIHFCSEDGQNHVLAAAGAEGRAVTTPLPVQGELCALLFSRGFFPDDQPLFIARQDPALAPQLLERLQPAIDRGRAASIIVSAGARTARPTASPAERVEAMTHPDTEIEGVLFARTDLFVAQAIRALTTRSPGPHGYRLHHVIQELVLAGVDYDVQFAK